MGKGEIAHYEQFLLFAQCFQNTCTTDIRKGLVWERVKSLSFSPLLKTQGRCGRGFAHCFVTLQYNRVCPEGKKLVKTWKKINDLCDWISL